MGTRPKTLGEPISIRLPLALDGRIREVAARRERSVTAVAQSLLIAGLADEQPPEPIVVRVKVGSDLYGAMVKMGLIEPAEAAMPIKEQLDGLLKAPTPPRDAPIYPDSPLVREAQASVAMDGETRSGSFSDEVKDAFATLDQRVAKNLDVPPKAKARAESTADRLAEEQQAKVAACAHKKERIINGGLHFCPDCGAKRGMDKVWRV